MSNSLLVGIDVSLNDNKVRILHPDGTSLSKFVVSNSVPGAKVLLIPFPVQKTFPKRLQW
jgi:hypothetical protein